VSSVLSIADQVFSGLTDQQMRARPATGLDSLVGLFWHMARVEDVGVNVIVTAGRQALDEGRSSRLGIVRTDVGSGMAEDELAEFATTVGRRTRDVVRALEPASWRIGFAGRSACARAARSSARQPARPSRGSGTAAAR
jgi:hypothetical protein